MHQISNPSILYFGTPVVLISTLNENNSYNLAPISSAFWLGWRCMIGISALSKTTENLLRTGECVLNLPSVNEVAAVNRLALTTGSKPVPEGKLAKGYRFEPDKFDIAGLSAVDSEIVVAPRVLECPVQMEAQLVATHPIAEESSTQRGKIVSIELKVVRVYLEESIQMKDNPDRVDPDKWRPLIMNFQQFYGLGEQVHPSILAQVPEQLYQSSDWKAARELSVE
ncbi:flavin reductase family protein [Cytophagaceae bacterium DM2B3-1]|uniref:Flavin reductase family protein n=2 Tax=Xanthocytophaga flava TaxID=3048013 RepID=A0ABT7CU74_9BACT|nr:flavin reductase family protein [Xanthocytophaga flavus]MDJ1496505.1 flavin reductase family protein [Xanthocytophaga flavus]